MSESQEGRTDWAVRCTKVVELLGFDWILRTEERSAVVNGIRKAVDLIDDTFFQSFHYVLILNIVVKYGDE